MTLGTWEAYRDARPNGIDERAAKCLFMNRTNFSGILSPTAGPIGGRRQSGEYRIDCRFPKETIAKRVRQIAEPRHRIDFVHEGD